MAGFSSARYRCGRLAVAGLMLLGAAGSAGSAHARPLRGPVMRAERRVARVEALIERELGRPSARQRPQAAAPAKAAPAAAATAPTAATATAGSGSPASATSPALAPSGAPAKPLAAPAAGGVAKAAFDAPTPAADGTFSVLVRPEGDAAPPASAGQPAQAGEPLRFPDSSAP
jgi:hypothetical protein